MCPPIRPIGDRVGSRAERKKHESHDYGLGCVREIPLGCYRATQPSSTIWELFVMTIERVPHILVFLDFLDSEAATPLPLFL